MCFRSSSVDSTYFVVAAVPSPNVSDGAADVGNCDPYGGALIPNVNPLAVVAVAGSATAGIGPIADGVAVPNVNGATDC